MPEIEWKKNHFLIRQLLSREAIFLVSSVVYMLILFVQTVVSEKVTAGYFTRGVISLGLVLKIGLPFECKKGEIFKKGAVYSAAQLL